MVNVHVYDATYVVQNDQGLGPAATVVTDGVEDAVAHNGGEELLDEQGQQDGADDGQEQVVDHEEGVELESGDVLHDLAAPEDDDVVGDQDSRGLLKGGQRGHALDELELAGGVTHDLLASLVEQWPQVDAKGSVEGREGHILKELGRHDGNTGGFCSGRTTGEREVT